MGVIYLTETNVNWDMQYIFNSFTKTLRDTWPKEKITTCTSNTNTNTTRKGDYKPEGTSITLIGRLSSSVINKGQDNSGLGRWIFTTILGRNNNKTTILNVYCPGNKAIGLVGNSTIIKQQWVLLQQLNRKEHPHNVIINDLIKAIKDQQQQKTRDNTHHRWQ